MFISFYITDSKNSLVFEYLLSSSSPPFSHLWTKIQTVCPELIVDHYDEDSSIVANERNLNRYTRSFHGSLAKDLEVYKFYSSINKLNYFCLTSRQNSRGNIEPFIFLESIDKELLEYFEKDQLTVSKLVNNYDRLAMIFYMCVDAGEPAVGRMDENSIKRMAPIRSDLSKIINSTASSIQKVVQRQPAATKNTRLFEQQRNLTNDHSKHESEVVPWRTGNLKYVDNEIYVDMLETIHLVFSKRQKKRNSKSGKGHTPTACGMDMVCGTICGTLNFRSHVSENPMVEIQLDLAGNYLGVPALHECVESEADSSNIFERLKFIPPDGKFCLMEYSLDLDVVQAKQSSYIHKNNGMVSVDFQDALGNKYDEFEITINVSSSRQVLNIKDLRVEVEIKPKNENEKKKAKALEDGSEERRSSSCDVDDTDYKIKPLRNTHGRFENSVIPGKGTWIFDRDTPVGALPVLRGCLEYTGDFSSSQPTCTVKVQRVSVSYSYTGELASGIKVKSIDVTSGIQNSKNLKLFKGVKYLTKTGDFEVRGDSSHI